MDGSVAIASGTCTHGGGLFRRSCGSEATGRCVYCGEPFCDEHGSFGDDFLEVCTRKACRAKLRDVEEHQAYIERVRVDNETSVCAQPGCSERMQHTCQRCNLLFCDSHLRPRQVLERRHDPPRRVTLLLCRHCESRRSLWD
jgi:hypothetical protein